MEDFSIIFAEKTTFVTYFFSSKICSLGANFHIWQQNPHWQEDLNKNLAGLPPLELYAFYLHNKTNKQNDIKELYTEYLFFCKIVLVFNWTWKGESTRKNTTDKCNGNSPYCELGGSHAGKIPHACWMILSVMLRANIGSPFKHKHPECFLVKLTPHMNTVFVSPKKATYKGYFRRRRRPLFDCQEHNFLTSSSNDTKLGVRFSCNELKCRDQ